MPLSVVSLHTYPVKGCGGVDLAVAELTPRGIRHDREFMLVDPEGTFVSQRGLPRLALFRAHLDSATAESTLSVTGPDGDTLRHPVRADGPRRDVWVHRSRTVGVDQGDQAARWFGSRLGLACRLVRLPDDARRPVDPQYTTAEVSYADAFPLLVTTVESLADLNGRLDRPVPMNRFRPNLVLAGWDEPWAEDRVRLLRAGRVPIELIRRCGRCTVTTVDQATGVAGREPLHTLATFRQVDQRLLFGVYAVPRGTGEVRRGDPVELLDRAVTPL